MVVEEVVDFLGNLHGGFAVGAEAADEALGLTEGEGIGQEVVLDAHGEEPGNGAEGIVGAEGGEHEVTGESGVDGGAGGLRITGFTDEDDIGVGAQEGAQAGGEVEAVEGVGLGLVDAFDFVFDGVLNGLDVDVVLVDGVEEGVERGRLAGTGGAGDEGEALVAPEDLLDDAALARGHVELAELFNAVLFVEETHDDFLHFLAVGDGGDPDIDALLAEDHGETAILRGLAFLCHVRPVLDDGDVAHEALLGAGVDDDEFAIDTGAEAGGVVEFLHVQVGPAHGEGAVDDPFDQFVRGGIGVGGIDLGHVEGIDLDEI